MYVRKTQTLVDDIEHEVFRMQQNAISQLREEVKVDIGTPLHAEMKLAIENTLWQDAPELKDKMPSAWASTENNVEVNFTDGDHKVLRHTFNSRDNDEIKVPPNHRRYNSYPVPEKFWTPLIQEWIASRHKATATQDTIKSEYENIRYQLVSFMGKHASLNTALKEMPELELYVPNSYIEKVNKKEERVRAKASAPTTNDDVEVDVDALTRAAVAHRLTSNNN